MSARDTFEWYLTTQLGKPSPELERFIRTQRAYFFTLRSEDERQRFVEWVMGAAARLVGSELHSPPARQGGKAVGK